MSEPKNNAINPKLEASWLKLLNDVFQTESFAQLKQFLVNEQKEHTVYPPGSFMFRAFNETPVHRVKVVILGQDPYHGPGQAEGLSFSVPPSLPVPPSLKNVYKELHDDLGCSIPSHGHLGQWARQGVLLLNAMLSVRAGAPGSHQNKGWEVFTDEVIRRLSRHQDTLVFLLWGKFAQSKASLIDETKHLILTAPHPSPFSAHTGFFGCRHFSQANEYLEDHGLMPIHWQIS